jgi:O-antigen ligase
MKRLWLYCFPLLFLPNFGFSQQTSFGVLEISDWLIVPFIILLLIAPSAKYKQYVSQLSPLLWTFMAWALLSTISIHFRYNYLDDVPILVGSSLKLARLALYVIASILIARALSDPAARRKWLWSLVAALFMMSIGLLASSRAPAAQPSDAIEGYKSYNVIIVSIAILCSYIAGLWIDNVGSRIWSKTAGAVVIFAGCSVLLSSSLTSHGRGGWVAFAVGFGYIAFKRTQAVKTFAILVIVGVASLTAYATLPTFKSLVNETFSPDEGATSQPVDDGARLSTWAKEAPKLVNSPVLGTGFYHRGGDSGLWSTGSHNFFIQMFLETGIVGGTLIISIFAATWWQAGLISAVRNKISLATRAALITAIAGGMSGEYYYGGAGVLVLFAAIALAGSLPTARFAYVNDGVRLQSLRLQVSL